MNSFLLFFLTIPAIFAVTTTTPSITKLSSNTQILIQFDSGLLNATTLWSELTFNLTSSSGASSKIHLTGNIVQTSSLTFVLVDLSSLTIDIGSSLLCILKSSSTEFAYSPSTISTSLLPYSGTSSAFETIALIDFVVEIIWTIFSTINSFLNPTSFIFLDAKLFRESLDMLKLVNVNYQSGADQFFRGATNKVSGFRIPNLFSFLIYEESFQTSYEKTDSFSNVPIGRYKELTSINLGSRFKAVLNYSTFVDNYGAQLCTIVLFLFLTIIGELFAYFSRKRPESNWMRIANYLRYLIIWNFTITYLVGGSQSLFLYGFIQLKAASYIFNMTTMGFTMGFCVFFVSIGFLFPISLFSLMKQKKIYEKEGLESNIAKSYVSRTKSYMILIENFKQEKQIFMFTIIILLFRSIFFGAIIAFLDSEPLIQIALLGVFGFLFGSLLIALRPFTKKYMNIFHGAYEGFYLVSILMVCLIYAQDANSDYSSGARDIFEWFNVIIWLLVGFMNIGTVVYDFIQFRKLKNSGVQIYPEAEIKSAENTIIHEEKQIEETKNNKYAKFFSANAISPEKNFEVHTNIPTTTDLNTTRTLFVKEERSLQLSPLKTPENKYTTNLIKVHPISNLSIYGELTPRQPESARAHSMMNTKREEDSYLGAHNYLNTDRKLDFGSRSYLMLSKDASKYIDENGFAQYVSSVKKSIINTSAM